jgi:CRISPR-associated protein Cas1
MSLVYDVQELYRWLIDLSVIQLLEEKRLKKSDFITTENYNIRLRESAAKALISKITLNFNKTAEYKNKNHSYEFILLDNVRALADYVIERRNALEFDVPTVENERNDSLELRERVLQITPEQRRHLGINKSTLWYMQKHIKEEKRIKVYNKIKVKVW